MGWDPKLGLRCLAIKRKLNFACGLLSCNTAKSVICTTNMVVNRCILTWEKVGEWASEWVFGWHSCLEGLGCGWVNHSHAPGCHTTHSQIHCQTLALFFFFYHFHLKNTDPSFILSPRGANLLWQTQKEVFTPHLTFELFTYLRAPVERVNT